MAGVKTVIRLSGPSTSSAPKLKVVRDPVLRIRQAVRDNNVSLLTRLQLKYELRNTDRGRLTSLAWAAIEGSVEVFEWLALDYGHDDHEISRDIDDNTILHFLAAVPSPPGQDPLPPRYSMLPAHTPRHPPAVQQALALRMAELYITLFSMIIDSTNQGGKSCLHVAAQAGNAAFISLVCDHGAELDVADLQGNTPLHYASAWGHIDAVRMLIARGCNLAVVNRLGFTASDYAFSDRIREAIHRFATERRQELRAAREREGRGPDSPIAPEMTGGQRWGSETPTPGGSNSPTMAPAPGPSMSRHPSSNDKAAVPTRFAFLAHARLRSDSVSTGLSGGSAGAGSGNSSSQGYHPSGQIPSSAQASNRSSPRPSNEQANSFDSSSYSRRPRRADSSEAMPPPAGPPPMPRQVSAGSSRMEQLHSSHSGSKLQYGAQSQSSTQLSSPSRGTPPLGRGASDSGPTPARQAYPSAAGPAPSRPNGLPQRSDSLPQSYAGTPQTRSTPKLSPVPGGPELEHESGPGARRTPALPTAPGAPAPAPAQPPPLAPPLLITGGAWAGAAHRAPTGSAAPSTGMRRAASNTVQEHPQKSSGAQSELTGIRRSGSQR